MQASQDLLLRHLLGQEGFFWKPDLYRTQLELLQHPRAPQRAPDCGEHMAGKLGQGHHIISSPARRGALEIRREDTAEDEG